MSGHVHRGSENGNRFSPTGREVLTLTGKLIDITAPQPEDIRLVDIARSLAEQRRFTGHCPLRPTVAEHSLAVEWIAGELFARTIVTDPLDDWLLADLNCRREALMHDGTEFLVSDINGAVKKEMRPRLHGVAARGSGRTHGESRFDQLETLAEQAITTRFGLTSDWGAIVHEADCMACSYEMAHGGWCIDADPPQWVRRALPVIWSYGQADGGEAAFLRRAEFLGIR